MQHVEVRSEKPAKVILTAWVAADKLQNAPSISIDINYMDGSFSLDHRLCQVLELTVGRKNFGCSCFKAT